MMREATTALIALMILAGCIAAPQELDAAAQTLDSPLLASLGAYSSDATFASDAIVLRTTASPEGGITAFWWEIPEGVILEEDDDEKRIQFLAAPVLLEAERAPLERWTLMAFLAKDGHLALNSLAFGAPVHVGFSGLMGGGSEEVERSLEPFLFSISGKLSAGGRVGFVVAGAASDDVEMALVLKPLEKPWNRKADLPEDTEQFLAALGSAPRVALPPVGTGGAHQLALHFDGGSMFGSFTVTTGPVEREGGSTKLVAAQRRVETVSTGFASRGYGLAATGFYAQNTVGSWSGVADAHGAVSEGGGPVITAFGPSLTGWPFVVAIGEGEAESRTSITLDTTSAGFIETVYLIQFDLGATLQELLGLPALKLERMSGTGQAERAGDDLTATIAGIRIHGVGVF